MFPSHLPLFTGRSLQTAELSRENVWRFTVANFNFNFQIVFFFSYYPQRCSIWLLMPWKVCGNDSEKYNDEKWKDKAINSDHNTRVQDKPFFLIRIELNNTQTQKGWHQNDSAMLAKIY